MKFVRKDMGAAAEASSGGGQRGLVRELLTLAVLISILLATLYVATALVTDVAISRISPEREMALFEQVADEFKSDEVPQELSERWLRANQVLLKLLAYEGVPKLDYTLIYQDLPDPNAFAIPGGTIAVTRGLLESLDEEIAIAFVLGHELGHFAQRDHLKGIGRKVGFSAGVQLLFGADLAAFSRGGTEFLLLRYSRGQESNADLFGLACIEAVYGETGGAERLFEVLDAQDTLPKWAYMFATHPDHQSRIDSIRNRAAPSLPTENP